MTEASADISSQATGTQTEEIFRPDFEFYRELPPNVSSLDAIARNFYWSWQPDGAALFRDLDPDLWTACEQNPRVLLKQVSDLRLWQRAADADYVARVGRFNERFNRYLNERTGEVDTNGRIAYFCAEYGVHNSLPNYSGGLGILAGDHLKSASDLDLPLTAIGLLYRFGYFRQNVRHDGWQEEGYNDVFRSELALTPVYNADGARVKISIHIREREVFAQAWLANVGRISLYLLDTNLPENSDIDRLITGHLYGGDVETRIVQEKVLGIGGVRLLRKLGIDPDVFHLNEGHSAFLTLELAREYLSIHQDRSFRDAMQAVREKCVFTTHTPVAAGNDVFESGLLRECFSAEFVEGLKLSDEEFLAMGRANPANEEEFFGMTPLAIRMCRSANGVSAKHGEVSRALWLQMFPDLDDPGAVPITSVTNGVHAGTWIAPIYQNLYRQRLGDDWNGVTCDADRWAEMVYSLSDHELWQTHLTLKELLIAFIRERTRAKDIGKQDTINERVDTSDLFSANVLTIGFARRVAAYKRWDLLFTDVERLLKMVDDAERPVQFVFAGKAHPQDKTAKTILQELMTINHDSNWQRRAVFIEDYDQEVARYLVQGVDVWLNVPRRPMEASGTSGMKAAMNGVLNASILDGWWIEAFNGENGFAIGDLMDSRSEERADADDAEALYSIFENEIIPAYYSAGENGLPNEWINRMKNSMATITPRFCSDRMVKDYLHRIYYPSKKPMQTEFTTGAIKATECAREAWEIIKSDYWLLFAISIVGALIGGVSFYVLIGAMVCGIFYCYLRKIDGHAVTFDDLWVGFKFFWPSLLVTIFIVVPIVVFTMVMFTTIYLPIITAAVMGNKADGGAIMASFLVGIVIDLVIALVMVTIHSLLIFSYPLIVDRNLSSRDAIVLSARAVLKNIGGVGGLIVVNFCLALLGELLFCVGIYLVIPIITATNIVAYRKVFPRLDGPSLNPPSPPAFSGI
jgi:starch phosphorylase